MNGKCLKCFYLSRVCHTWELRNYNNHPSFFSYFNYRTTRFLAEEGFYKFHNWFDDRAWYPLGRIIGGTIYPGENKFNCWISHAFVTASQADFQSGVVHCIGHIEDFGIPNSLQQDSFSYCLL